jgi:glycine cleavage system H lipoate-binding protein
MVLVMVFLTVVCSIAAVETVAWLKRRREFQESAQRSTEPVIGEVYWHPGHAWLRVLSRERAAIGIDGFALRLLGRVDEVRLPDPGTGVRKDEPFASVRQGTRWVHFSSPVDGTVAEINPRGVAESREGEERYEKGWLCRLQASDLKEMPAGLIGPHDVREWMARQVQTVMEFFARQSVGPQIQPMIPDGGTLVDGLLEQADDETWTQLTARLFEAPSHNER